MKKKLQTALEDPGKIPPFISWKVHRLSSPVMNMFHRHVRSRGASIFDGDFHDRYEEVPREVIQGISNTFFSDLDLTEKQGRDFHTYLQIPIFAYHFDCERVLEIGAGFSTAIWADYANRTGASVTSIDANFELLDARIDGTRYRRLVDNHAELVEGLSIDPNDVDRFYSEPRSELGDVPVSDFANHIEGYTRAEGCPWNRIETISRVSGRRDWSVRDVITVDGGIYFPDEILELYTDAPFDEYVSNLDGFERTGVLNELSEVDTWDLIWFDSGELSSVIEWELLKDRIEPGGIAAFHDIFFPKSMKNFLVAASIIADPEWELLLVDASTIQGLMIARRTEE